MCSIIVDMRIRSQYLLNPYFVTCLLILLVNDFWLKATFHNWLTGKLSDISGVAMMTLLIFAIGGWTAKRQICFIIASLFIFWKSACSQPIIDAWNTIGLVDIGRTVDYTDIPCLLILIPVYYYEPGIIRSMNTIARKITLASLAVLGLFSTVATSKIKRLVGNNLYVNTRMKLSTERETLIARLRNDHVQVEYDTFYTGLDTMFQYKISNFILNADTFPQLYLNVYKDSSGIAIYVPEVELTPARLATIKKEKDGIPKALVEYRNKLQVFFRKYE